MPTQRADARAAGAVDQALVPDVVVRLGHHLRLGLAVAVAVRALGVAALLVVVLHDLRRDFRVHLVLLARALGRRRHRRDGHGRAAAVVDQVRGGRDAGGAAVGAEAAFVVGVGLGRLLVFRGRGIGDVAVAAEGCQAALLARGHLLGLGVGVVGELQAFDGGCALLRDVADDVRDSIGLVTEMTVGNIDDAHVGEALAIPCGWAVVEASLHVWRHICSTALGAGRCAGLDATWLFSLFAATLLSNVLKVILFVTILDVLGKFVFPESTDDMLHVMSLAADQTAQMQDNPLSLVTLTLDCGVGVLKLGELLLVTLALAFKLFSNLLLKDKSLEGIITLLLGSSEADSETSGIVLLLFDETCKATSFALVVLNFDLEVCSLLGELFGKGLEFKEL